MCIIFLIILKLHFQQIRDQVNYLSSHDVIVAIATPNRLHKLISDDHLKLNHVKLLILDWYWRDKKLKRMQDIPEVRHIRCTALNVYKFYSMYYTCM